MPLDGIGGVGAEPIPEGEVELLNCPHQGHVAVAHEFFKRIAGVDELLGDGDDEPQVRRDDDRLHGFRLGEPALDLLHLPPSGPLLVEPAPRGRCPKLEPVHPAEVILLLVFREQAGLVEAREIRREPLGGRSVGGIAIERHGGIGRRRRGERRGVLLQELTARDVVDRTGEEPLPVLTEFIPFAFNTPITVAGFACCRLCAAVSRRTPRNPFGLTNSFGKRDHGDSPCSTQPGGFVSRRRTAR